MEFTPDGSISIKFKNVREIGRVTYGVKNKHSKLLWGEGW